MSKTREIEIRTANLGTVELRAGGSGIGQLVGYAAVFNRHSQNLGGFVEQVDPSAFTKSIADGVRVLCRGNHDDAFLFGTTSAGTLSLEVDGTGLQYIVDLPDTSAGRDFKVLAERGDIVYSSFAFRTIEDQWGVTDQGFPLRTLKAVQLVDVAPVNSPAYLDTSVGLRSLEAHLATKTPAGQQPAGTDVDEQRATHPSPSVRARLLELDALK